ncbi:hypothetical protein GOP47_0024044 [Adiantum capillus-veneris]|uniref:Beta-hexosaminidase n=1 Tax=Adiantum capillus-veneris TaxID=13818 RepID=A0A9D4Z511_ADICA|nr:hypothetical protein GOP47_0024044 [Adiantum capillus-veneris]
MLAALILSVSYKFRSSNTILAHQLHDQYRQSTDEMGNDEFDHRELDSVDNAKRKVEWGSNATSSNEGSSQDSVLFEAVERYRALIFSRPVSSVAGLRSSAVVAPLISCLRLHVQSALENLRFGVDESYTLAMPDPVNASQALIQANTVLASLLVLIFLLNAVLYILSIRPPRVIKEVIDAMSYAKLNVLHWHIVDTQSFPLEIPSYPKLWEGSFSPWERYTMDDAQDIVEYARKRGVNVMPELDVPGHAASWGVGYPQLWPSANCTQPLDVTRNFTFRLIDGIISDFAKVFRFDFVHMGGDEVNTSCWTETPRIEKWLREKNYSGFDAYKQFVLQAESVSAARGYTPVNWEEPFNLFGAQLNRKTVIHNWLGRGVAAKVVKAGLRCIVSNQDAWYLDHLDVPWQTFYSNEPWANVTEASERALVLGGEVCMWGEMVDASDIQQTIWPRAAAAAERLWSNFDEQRLAKVQPDAMLPRLRHFRCLLNERGIASAPVVGLQGRGRDPPFGPGSCYSQ